MHAPMRSKLAALTAVALTLFICMPASAVPHTKVRHNKPVATKPLGMVTGPVTGTYIQIGRDIAGLAKLGGIPIEVKPSLGSIDNIRRMSTRSENAGLGLVQSDVLGFLKRSQSPESQLIASKLRMIAPFYAEEVHLLTRADIHNVAELAGKRIVVGTEGSGSMLTATNIFGLLGVKPSNLYKVAPPEGIVAILTGQADAMIFVGGKPVKLFKNMEELKKSPTNAEALKQVHFLPLNDARLKEDYSPATITSADYSFVDQPVPTVAVRAMLVSYDFTLKDEPYYHARCAELGRLGKTLEQQVTDLQKRGHPKWKEVDLSADVGLWQRDACAWPAMQAKKQAVNAPAPKPHAPITVVVHQPETTPLPAGPKASPQTERLQQDLLHVVGGKQ